MSERMSPRNTAILVTVIVALGAYVRFIEQPRMAHETQMFQSLSPADVTRIEIQGANANSLDLVKTPFSIQDAGEIQTLCEAMRDAKQFLPGHPISRWNCEICFVTAARTWCVEISSTTNNGVAIYLPGGNGLRNDSLGPTLEKIVKDHGQTRTANPGT